MLSGGGYYFGLRWLEDSGHFSMSYDGVPGIVRDRHRLAPSAKLFLLVHFMKFGLKATTGSINMGIEMWMLLLGPYR